MPGQIIKLSGVTAASTVGVPRILMGAADKAALRVSSLAHVVSPKSMSATSSGVTGRCRATGKKLVPKGVAADLQLRTVGGFTGIGLSRLSAAGLALPAGSATPSYTIVMAIQMGQSDIDGATPANLVYTSTDAGADVATILRYYGKAYAGSGGSDLLLASGSTPYTANTPAVIKPRPDGAWIIVAIDYNDVTRVLSMALNGAAYTAVTKPANHAPGAGGYFTIGYPNSSASLRGSMLGDLYLFSDSLLKTPSGQDQLAAVVAGLKSDYGIQ